ncbi:MAG: hypothetical protein ACLR5H_07760 [Oscillospiraceae bacterium]
MVVHTNSPGSARPAGVNLGLILSQHDCNCATLHPQRQLPAAAAVANDLIT